MEKDIVFVDEHDTVVGAGTMEESRRKGIRHRISRIFLTNKDGNILIAKRALHLKTQPGKWGESVAGHVDAGESYVEAALREMEEEIGVTGVELHELAKFYTERVEGDLMFNRFNMLFSGTYDGVLNPNDEVAETRWLPKDELEEWMREKPDEFTYAAIRAFGYL